MTIEERAKEWGEHIVETTPYDVVDGKACVFVEDRDIADVAEESYIAGAKEQKAIDEEVRLKKCDDMTQAEYDREVAFAEWYHKNGNGTPTFSDAIEWARKEVIDDARKWFADYLMDIGYPDDWLRDSPNMKSGEERFIKAMEEQNRIKH